MHRVEAERADNFKIQIVVWLRAVDAYCRTLPEVIAMIPRIWKRIFAPKRAIYVSISPDSSVFCDPLP